MADKYIIAVQPKISGSDGQKMENDLNRRFKRVADKFGGTLKTVGSKLKGVLAGATAGVVGAVAMNPYDEVSKNIDEATMNAGALYDKALQYNTSAGKMFQTQQLLASKGIMDFETVLDRFAVKLDQARSGEDTTLSEFTNEKDVIDAMFKALASMQSLSGEGQARMLQQIFGGRQGFALAPLITEDMQARSRMIFGDLSTKDFDAMIKRLDDVGDQRDISKAIIAQEALRLNSEKITAESVGVQRSVEEQRIRRQTARYSEIETFAKSAEAMDKMAEGVDQIQEAVLARVAPTLDEIVGTNKWIGDNIKKYGVWNGLGNAFFGNKGV